MKPLKMIDVVNMRPNRLVETINGTMMAVTQTEYDEIVNLLGPYSLHQRKDGGWGFDAVFTILGTPLMVVDDD